MEKSVRSSWATTFHFDKIPLVVSAFHMHTVFIGDLVMFDGFNFMYSSPRMIFVSSTKLRHVFDSDTPWPQF